MQQVAIEEYMNRERLPLTYEIDERRIHVSAPSTTFINVVFNEKTDIARRESFLGPVHLLSEEGRVRKENRR